MDSVYRMMEKAEFCQENTKFITNTSFQQPKDITAWTITKITLIVYSSSKDGNVLFYWQSQERVRIVQAPSCSETKENK